MDLQSAGTHAGSGFISGLLVFIGYKKYVETRMDAQDKAIEAEAKAREAVRAEAAASLSTAIKAIQEATTRAISDIGSRTEKTIDEIKATTARMAENVVWQDACENCKKAGDAQESATVRALDSMDKKIDILIEKAN